MPWNWEHPGWPQFTYQAKALEALERQFLWHSGEFVGAFKHIGPDDRKLLRIELVTDEALKTSEIEGEVLDPPACNPRCGSSPPVLRQRAPVRRRQRPHGPRAC